MADHTKVASQGFVVHGDETGLEDTAWHDETDRPADLWEWYNLGRRGGSLEKGIASLEDLQTEVEAGGLVNLYWIGRVNDATVRHDRDVLAYLDEAPNVWLTTWGEAWSSWSGKRCYEYQRDVAEVEGKTVITFESKETEVCRSVFDELPWNVPSTWLIDVEGASVIRRLNPRHVLATSLYRRRESGQGRVVATSGRDVGPVRPQRACREHHGERHRD